MYRHRGIPVSIFMVPGEEHRQELVKVFGHDAVIWSEPGRTFVLIAQAEGDDAQKVATFVKASLR